MTHDEHPIFTQNGYQISTKPTEALANFIVANIGQGYHGCSTYGGGGVGKTTAQQYLTDNSATWLLDHNRQQLGVAARMIMPSGMRRSDRAFWGAMNQRLHISSAVRVDPGAALDRLVNFVRLRCGHARQRRMVMFIDNAQRITDAEYQYLEDLDAMVSEEKLSLFLVLVRQDDAGGVQIGDDWLSRPSHTVRRWFMDTAPFRPLTGAAEVTHALGRYDRAVTWPTPDMPFSRYFAKEAFDRGWTLAKEAPRIMAVLREIRKTYKLPESDEWPMATFTLTVHQLLITASLQVNFNGFTDDQVREALLASGYLRLEFVRARMRMPDQPSEQQPTEAA